MLRCNQAASALADSTLCGGNLLSRSSSARLSSLVSCSSLTGSCSREASSTISCQERPGLPSSFDMVILQRGVWGMRQMYHKRHNLPVQIEGNCDSIPEAKRKQIRTLPCRPFSCTIRTAVVDTRLSTTAPGCADRWPVNLQIQAAETGFSARRKSYRPTGSH